MTQALLVLFLLAAPIPPKLEQGQKAFSEGQFDAAIKLLDAAAAEERDPEWLEKIHLLRGQAFAAKADFGRAEAAFAAALEANPEASLDPGRVDPAVVKLLESMRARSSGTLTFRSKPPGAHISVDGVDQGPTPLTMPSAIGRHKVDAKWADDKYAQAEVMVRAKRETFVELVLHEKIVEVQVKVPTKCLEPEAPPPERFVHPFAQLRAAADLNAGPEGGLDFGVGLDFKYLSLGVWFRPYRYLYVIPHVGGIYPLFDFLSLFAELEVSVRPLPGRFGLAIGGNVGAEYFIKPWLSAFAELGGKGFVINDTFVVDVRVSAGAGVKIRVP